MPETRVVEIDGMRVGGWPECLADSECVTVWDAIMDTTPMRFLTDLISQKDQQQDGRPA